MTHIKTTCKTCLLYSDTVGSSRQKVLDDIFRSQDPMSKKSEAILRKFGKHISVSSLRRHINNHSASTPSNLVKKESVDIKPGQAKVDYSPSTGGTAVSPAYTNEELSSIDSLEDVLEYFGIDSSKFRVVNDTVRISKWQQKMSGEYLTSYRFSFEPKEDEESLKDYINELSKKIDTIPSSMIGSNNGYWNGKSEKLHIVINLSDFQIGKVDVRGGTEELLNRIDTSFELLNDHIKESISTQLKEDGELSITICELGDIIEGFENTSSQQFLNDLSLMSQVELAIKIVSRFINLALSYTQNVRYVSVPSNHCGWRSGKGYLGKPSDDWGIFISNVVSMTFGDKVEVITPQEFKKTVTAVFDGLIIGFGHGDDHKNGKAVEWLIKQTMANEPVADCDVFVHGHYHNHYVQTAGRTRFGNQRWVVGVATSDNGSSWYTNTAGIGETDPGITVINVIDGKFRPQNVYLL